MKITAIAAEDDDDVVRALAAVAELRRQVDQREEVLVRRARTQSLTWAEIATLLGVSRQAVHQRYGGSRRERRRAPAG
ncbi:hypothetical protein [Nocardioides lijunqiniae]|uniref:hypothetical protein n=1 Tax=Nocardioides lijunqiniae TaxID=2760832 RepID=UPI001878BBDC|nr:hypothetical protein [Nocardioides lijunqiniae]